MSWIYLSPHFDDVSLSCGGLVWEQTRSGDQVSIWTICGGDPPLGDISDFAKSLHTRWEIRGKAPVERKVEDINSCRWLGASYQHFSLPDCIYRRDPRTGEFLYASEQALNGPLHPSDRQVIEDLETEFQRVQPGEVTLVCPLALGNHVDHQLTRLAAEASGIHCRYYADFPYVLREPSWMSKLIGEGWENQVYPISNEGLAAWQDSISAHHSQISTFWPSEAEMRRVVGRYLHDNGGIRLWSRPVS